MRSGCHPAVPGDLWRRATLMTMTAGRCAQLAEPADGHDLARELADRPVAHDVAGPRRVQDPVAADVDRDVVRAAGAGVAEEDQVAGLLVGQGDAVAGADLVAGVVGESDASAGGLVGGVQDEAGAVEASAGGSVEVAAAPDVRLAELRRGGLDEVAGEPGREVERYVARGLRARQLAATARRRSASSGPSPRSAG